MTTTAIGKQVKGIECKFAIYCPPFQQGGDDYHLVKELVHYTDGTTAPNIRYWKNFERPFYITKKGAQNHEQKKEWELKSNVIPFTSRQSQLHWNISKALGMPGARPDTVTASPFLYGSDILSTAVLKKHYQDKYPDLLSYFSVACFDVETDVLNDTGEIIMATLSFGSRVITVCKKSYLEGYSNVQERAHSALKKYLSAMEYVEKKDKATMGQTKVKDYLAERGIQWEFVVVDTEIEIVKRCFQRAHEWKPDFVAIWNIKFDMQKMIDACERAGVDPAEIFSDPSVPRQHRFFKFKLGPSQKKTASGKTTPIKPADQWHTVFTPASFYFIDAMCVYRKIRIAKGEEQSYSLDFILDKILGARKLKFKETDGLEKIEWHIAMQSDYKFEYIIYNVFDCVSMEALDEETLDLRLGVPMQSGTSDFENFKSQPRRTADALHWFVQLQGEGYVFGSTSREMAVELDDEVTDLKGWIVTLPAHLVAENGLRVIAENPLQATNIRAHVADRKECGPIVEESTM